jgi:hypothetical protein
METTRHRYAVGDNCEYNRSCAPFSAAAAYLSCHPGAHWTARRGRGRALGHYSVDRRRPSTTLADYSRRCLPQIHFRQCGHRCGGSRAKSSCRLMNSRRAARQQKDMEPDGVSFGDINLFRNTELAHSLHAHSANRPASWYLIHAFAEGTYKLVQNIEPHL